MRGSQRILTIIPVAGRAEGNEYSATELRRGAADCGDGRVACRLLAIAHVLDGRSRTEAAELCGMERQTLRDWVGQKLQPVTVRQTEVEDDGIVGNHS